MIDRLVRFGYLEPGMDMELSAQRMRVKIASVFSLCLSLFLGISAATKLLNPMVYVNRLEVLLHVPRPLFLLLAAGLPAVEMLLAVGLAFPRTRRASLVVASFVLACFTLVSLTYRVHQGIGPAGCPCFPGLTTATFGSASQVVRDLFAFDLAVAALGLGKRSRSGKMC